MAFGLLGTIIPPTKQNTTWYTGTADKLTVGKISVTSKNPDKALIRLGYLDGGEVRYFEYNKLIRYQETYETQDIHLGSGQQLVVRSDRTDINFLYYGQTVSDYLNPIKSGVLNNIISNSTTPKTIFVAPSGSRVSATLSMCNLGSDISRVKIGISDAGLGDFDSREYIEYNITIKPGQTYTRTDLKLQEGQTLVGSSDNGSNISFLCHGRLYYAITGLPDSDDLIVLGNARISGNVGIGITASTNTKFHVDGSSILTGDVNITGGNLDVAKSLNVKGDETNLFTTKVRIKDSNLEIGYVLPGSFTGDIVSGTNVITNVGDTSGIAIGMIITIPNPNQVTIPADTKVTNVSGTTVEVDNNFQGTGSDSVTFDTAGASNQTANTGGITVKAGSDIDKTIKWQIDNSQFNFSEGINLAAGKQFTLDNVAVLTHDQVLGMGITMHYPATYSPTGVSTEHIPTQKSTDDLISTRGKFVNLSAFFAAGIDF